MKFQKSKSGLVFASLYLAFAIVLFCKAMTCREMLCALGAWPVILPVGIPIVCIIKILDKIYFFGTSYTVIDWGSLVFIIPTMIGNMICYFWLGVLIGNIINKLKPKT